MTRGRHEKLVGDDLAGVTDALEQSDRKCWGITAVSGIRARGSGRYIRASNTRGGSSVG